jgi:hypothetical protein
MNEVVLKPMDVFWRSGNGRNEDDPIQLGIANPDLPYGDRPVEVVLVTRATAAHLIATLAYALAQ